MSRYPVPFSVDLRDLRFALFEVFRIQDLLAYDRFRHLQRDQLETALSQAERMAREVVFPINRVADQIPPQYRDGEVTLPPPIHAAFRKYGDAGWIALTLRKEAGGWGFPESMGAAIREMFNGASGGFFAFSSLTTGALNLIDSFGSERLKQLFVDKMARGTFTGTMCLTEPSAGSYLADIITRATRDGDHFKIKGTKVFIGCGAHDLAENIIHCVLARIEGAPSGYRGISLFVVPRFHVNEDGTIGPSNDVQCGGIERKMGHEGAPTAILHFGGNDRCHGWLLGQEGQGLSHMFQMMNELRLGTAIQGTGQAAAAYRLALAFARERVQGISYRTQKGDPLIQVPIIEHPDVRRNLLFMKAVVEGSRRMNLFTGLCIDLWKSMDDETERERYHDLAEILTPICKAYASDMGFRVTETAVQTMGGYGYIKDYQVEQYLRDIKPTSIYEGTNGIQAIDLTRRKLNLKGGALFQVLVREIDRFIDENLGHPVLGRSIAKLKRTRHVMVETSRFFTEQGEKDAGVRLSMARPFLDLAGHVLCTWMLLKSAAVASSFLENPQVSDGDRAFYRGKVLTAQFAASHFLPQVDAMAETITSGDRSVLDLEVEGF